MPTESVARIALLAPFEGRYREIGYNALYAARLALGESRRTDIELLPVDDGGSVIHAIDRARALSKDPQLKAVIVIGYDASTEVVQGSFNDLPVLIVGNWLVEPQSDSIFILSHRDIPAHLSSTARLGVTEAAKVPAPFVGGDVFALNNFALLRNDFAGISVVSSGALPDDVFRQRVMESDPFAVEPALLATMVYDAVGVALDAVSEPTVSRETVRDQIAHTNYIGINGQFHFEAGYWSNAPIHTFTFLNNGPLTPAP